MEITTEDYLRDLVGQKQNLVSTLQECGVEANSNETLDALVPKVEKIYEAGRESIVNESKNTITTVSAKDVDENPHWQTFEYPLTITDVSDIPHKVKVRLYAHSEIGDYKPTLTITRNGVTETHKLDDAYDSTYEFDSSSPNMSFAVDNSVVEISVTYLKSWGIQYGIDYGTETERTNFWDNFFSGTLKNKYGRSLFAGGGWNEKTFTPIFPEGVTQITNSERMFEYFNRDLGYHTNLIDLSELCERLDFSKAKKTTYMFHNARAKNITVDLSSSTSLSQAFNCGNGGEFENLKIKVSELCTSYSSAFSYMYYIENLIFLDGSVIAENISFEKSTKLTKESIISIVNALSTTSSGKTLTLSKTAVNTAFNIDIDNVDTYPEGSEWYELRNSKNNWTFSFS